MKIEDFKLRDFIINEIPEDLHEIHVTNYVKHFITLRDKLDMDTLPIFEKLKFIKEFVNPIYADTSADIQLYHVYNYIFKKLKDLNYEINTLDALYTALKTIKDNNEKFEDFTKDIILNIETNLFE